MTIKDNNNFPKLQKDMNAILDRVAERLGAYMEEKLVAMMTEQYPDWKPLHPFTTERKGSTKAWIDKGEMRALVTHAISGTIPKKIEVGIFNEEKGYIAHILEFGCDIRVTEKMRGYLHSQGLHLKDTTAEIHIPERPLFRLVFDREIHNIEKLIEEELGKELDRYLF